MTSCCQLGSNHYRPGQDQQAKAARMLRIERTALRYKLKKYAYESPFHAVKEKLAADSDDEAA